MKEKRHFENHFWGVAKIVNVQFGLLLSYIQITIWNENIHTHTHTRTEQTHTHMQHSGDESPWLVKRLVNRHIWCHAKPNGVERVFVSVLISPPVCKAPLKTINSNERIQSPCSLNYIPLIWDTYYCWLYLMDWIPTPHPSGVSKHWNLQM